MFCIRSTHTINILLKFANTMQTSFIAVYNNKFKKKVCKKLMGHILLKGRSKSKAQYERRKISDSR